MIAGRWPVLKSVQILAALAALPSIVVLLGWIFMPDFLKLIFLNLPPMVPMTALIILLLSASLIGFSLNSQIRLLPAGFAMLLALVVVAEYIFQLELGIDVNGRTSPQTCAVVFLIALSHLLPRAFFKTRQTAVALALSMSLLAIIGFIYNAVHLFSISKEIGMALPTSICLLILAVGSLISESDRGIVRALQQENSAGFFLRRFALFGIAVPFLVAGLLRFGENLGFYSAEYATAGLLFFTVAALILLASFTARSLERIEEQKVALRMHEVDLANANEAGQLKNRFVANMSHELRTPLNAVLGYLECMRDPKLEPAVLAEFNARAERSASGLLRLLDDILDFSKIESENITISRRVFDPRSVIRDVVQLFNLEASHKGLQISIFGLELLPERLGSDPDRIRQILINLIGNAVKFTDRGSIRVETTFMAGDWIISVTDTGIGIPTYARERLFEVFSQVDDSITRRFGGSGLGLALSRRLATLLGGEIKLGVSQAEIGSQFELRLPCETFFNPSVAVPKVSSSTEIEQMQIAGRRLLLIEDNLDNQALMRMFLTSQGAVVDVAENGEVGVRKALASRPEAILMDLQMPIMGGLEATRLLRLEGVKIPIIAVSAHTTEQDQRRSFEAGCNLHLCKPVSKSQLVAAVKSALSKTN